MGTSCTHRRGLAVAAIVASALLPVAAWSAPETPAANALAPGRIIWQTQFGNSLSQGVSKLAVDASNSLIAYGTTAGALTGTSAGGTDVFLAKYNSAGTRLWIKQLGHPQNDQAIAMAVSSGGEIVIAGSIATSPAQWFLARYSSTGTLLWKKTFTTPRPAAIAVTPDNYIAAVTPNPAEAWTSNLELYTSNGLFIWRDTIPFLAANAIVSDRSGNLIIGGSDSTGLAALAKYTNYGTQIWWRDRYDLDGFSAIRDVVVDTGNVILVVLEGGWIMEFDGDGTRRVAESDNNPGSGSSLALAMNPAGEAVVGGTRTMYGQTGVDGLVTTFTHEAAIRWRMPYGTTGTDYLNDIAVDGAGNIYIGGWTNGALGGTALGGGDAYILKLRPF